MGRCPTQAPQLDAETPDLENPLGVRNLLPVREILTVSLGGRRESPDGHMSLRPRVIVEVIDHAAILSTL
jgi:hypothetical protein